MTENPSPVLLASPIAMGGGSAKGQLGVGGRGVSWEGGGGGGVGVSPSLLGGYSKGWGKMGTMGLYRKISIGLKHLS